MGHGQRDGDALQDGADTYQELTGQQHQDHDGGHAEAGICPQCSHCRHENDDYSEQRSQPVGFVDGQPFFTSDRLPAIGDLVMTRQVERLAQGTPGPPAAVAVGQGLAGCGGEIGAGQAAQQNLDARTSTAATIRILTALLPPWRSPELNTNQPSKPSMQKPPARFPITTAGSCRLPERIPSTAR